jgi:glutathionylspermidine synthase
LIIQEIKKVHKIDIKINQINELKLNNFECGIELRDDEGEELIINGFVK